MVDLRYKPEALWYESATPEEKAEVKRIDLRIKALAEGRKELTRKRAAITNRCTVRTIARRGTEG